MSINTTFLGLNIGAGALEAAQVAEDVTGNNIANANTPGYTEESVGLVNSPPFTLPNEANRVYTGQLGTGVVAQSVIRNNNQYLDNEVISSTSQNSQQSSLSTWLQNIQGQFNEPSNSGINAALTQFYANYTALESNPSSTAARQTVISGGQTLAQVFQSTQASLTQAGQQISAQTNTDMQTINSDAQEIASLNVAIRQAVAQNQQPNELEDQRQTLLTGLAKLVNITTNTNADGTVDVKIGSTALVTGVYSTSVDLPTLQSRGDIQSGEVSGLLQAQSDLSGYQSNLDTLANTVITDVNALQAGGTNSNGVVEPGGAGLDGSTGVPFFTGNSASTIAVNPALANSPQKLAAGAIPTPPATTPAPGDASIATQIAELQNAPSQALGNQSPLQYYQQLISTVGDDTKTANTAAADSSAALTQVTNQQQSVEGVNLDQEMTNMLQYQQAYQAAARLISTQDSMLDTLVNGIFSVPGQ